MRNINWIFVAVVFGGLGLLIFIISMFWIIFDPQYFHLFTKIDSKTAYELGGFISGLVGIFWSAAGVILIYATFTKQKDLNEKQQFETAFFNLLNNYNNLVNNAHDEVDKENNHTKLEYYGRSFLSAVLSEFKTGLLSPFFWESLRAKKEIPEIKEISEAYIRSLTEAAWGATLWAFCKSRNYDLSKEFVVFQYEFFYNKHSTQLGHIFRFLYNIFKFTIDERKTHHDEKRYIDLIQAQLSSDELGLLFYNALSNNAKTTNGELRFYDWLDKYNFFENIDQSSLLNVKHYSYYPNTTFKFLTKVDN